MKRAVRFLIGVYFFAMSFLASQSRGYLFISGTFDFDEDGESEFLSLETLKEDLPLPSIAGFYEIDSQGVHQKLWSFEYRYIAGAGIADLQGDGIPEIVLIISRRDVFDTKSDARSLRLGEISGTEPWIYIFSWEDGGFSHSPSLRWGGISSNLSERFWGFGRPTGAVILDLDNDGKDEIAVATGSPDRGIWILQTSHSSPQASSDLEDHADFKVLTRLSSDTLSKGYGNIFLSAFDYNQDGFTDLVALAAELNRVVVQIFDNIQGSLRQGNIYTHEDIHYTIDPRLLVGESIETMDVDQNGKKDIILPFKNGSVMALHVWENRLTISALDRKLAELFYFPYGSVSPAQLNEILLTRAEMGISAGTFGNELIMRTQKADTTKELIFELGKLLEETPSPGLKTIEGSPSKGEERKMPRLELKSLTMKEEIFATEPIRHLPPGAVISDTIPVGKIFTLPLQSDRKRTFKSFRPKTLPRGAQFDSENRSILWTPAPDQTGTYKFAFIVEYEIASDRIKMEEAGQIVRAVTNTEFEGVEKYVFVQSAFDIPK